MCILETKLLMLGEIFWVVPQRVVFNNWRFGTLYLFHLHKRVDMNCVKLETPKLWIQVQTDRPSPCTCLHNLGLSNFTHFISTHLWRWNRHSVPKRRLLNTTGVHSPMKMEQTQCSETSAIKHHRRSLAYEDGTDTVFRNVQHLEHGESLK
jgi:hypothetical protein